MIYLLKFTVCTLVLYAFYHFVLRNEALFRFNRFFLLGIVVLGLSIPLVITKTTRIEVPVSNVPIPLSTDSPTAGIEIFESAVSTADSTIDWLWLSYLSVSGLLLLRFIVHLVSIQLLKRQSTLVMKRGIPIALHPKVKSTFSFMSLMYANKAQFENGELPDDIIKHERAHIFQKHSLDVLLIEVMSCFLWFNPVIYLIKHAIKLNHEFLADAAVIKGKDSPVEYQKLLIAFASSRRLTGPAFTSQLTFGETKKRLHIMIKTTSRIQQVTRTAGAMSLIALLFLSLGKQVTIAQETEIATSEELSVEKTEVQEQDEAQEQGEVQEKPEKPVVVKRMIMMDPEAKIRIRPEGEAPREMLFKELTPQQQEDFADHKLPGDIWILPPAKKTITAEMLADFQDADKYGLWIDGTRQENSVLKNYNPEDFHHFYKSRLYPNAIHYGQYTYHLGLVTQKMHDKSPNRDGTWLPMKHVTLGRKKEEK